MRKLITSVAAVGALAGCGSAPPKAKPERTVVKVLALKGLKETVAKK